MHDPIVHRLFLHVTRACRGVIFRTLEVSRYDLSKTETTTDWRVEAGVFDMVYGPGRKCAAGPKESMRTPFDKSLPKWSYRDTILERIATNGLGPGHWHPGIVLSIRVVDSHWRSRRDSTAERLMLHIRGRGLITQAAVVIALLGSRTVVAQVVAPRGHGGLVNNLVTGASFEIVDQAKAERRLQHLEAKLRHDTARGNAAAAERDAYRVHRTRFRIGVDEWLIRYNTCQQLGPYPTPLRLDPVTCAALAHYHRPSYAP